MSLSSGWKCRTRPSKNDGHAFVRTNSRSSNSLAKRRKTFSPEDQKANRAAALGKDSTGLVVANRTPQRMPPKSAHTQGRNSHCKSHCKS